jgi:hypothetical protein
MPNGKEGAILDSHVSFFELTPRGSTEQKLEPFSYEPEDRNILFIKAHG